jgi:hypothetical protein
MTIETLPRQPLDQPTSRAGGRLSSLWAWLRKDHGIWTDLFFGAIPVVPILILLAIPGSTLLKAVAEYAMLAVLLLIGLFLHAAWKQARTWYRKRA